MQTIELCGKKKNGVEGEEIYKKHNFQTRLSGYNNMKSFIKNLLLLLILTLVSLSIYHLLTGAFYLSFLEIWSANGIYFIASKYENHY